MAGDYEFVTYTDIGSLHDPSIGNQVRKHAMKRVSATRRQRQPRERKVGTIELSWSATAPSANSLVQYARSDSDALQVSAMLSIWDGRLADDRALYNAFIRSLSCRMDPFGTASVPIDATVRTLLHYFMFYASRSPNTWTYSSSALLPHTPTEHRASISRTVASALQDSLIGNCLLATAASRLQFVDGALQLQLKEKELSLTQEALRLLQARLRKVARSDDPHLVTALVTCALHLGGAAFYKEDITTAGLHVKAAVTLAKRIGGVLALPDPYVRGRIISFDDLISCIELRPCLLDSNYDPGPVSPLASLGGESVWRIETEPLAGELLPEDSPMLSSVLQELIVQILQCHHARCNILASDCTKSSGTLANLQWLSTRTSAIRNRLLAFRTSERRTHILRVVLLMWTLLPPDDIKQAKVVNSIAPKLKFLLQQRPLLDWTGCEAIHFWCLLLGHCCAREGSAVEKWFAEEVQGKLRNCIITAIVDVDLLKGLIAFQMRFLYHAPVQEPVTEKLVEWLLRSHR